MAGEQFGYHTGDVLEDILTKQRAQKRQDMIDEINRQNIQSEISARNEQADAARVQKEAFAGWRNQQIQDSKDKAARIQRFSDALKGLGSQTVPNPNAEQGPPDPTDPTERVTASQKPVPLMSQVPQETGVALQLLQALGPDDPKSDALLQTIVSGMTKGKTGQTRPGGYIWTSDRAGNPYNTGEWMEGVQGDQYHERPAAQQPNAANTPFPNQVYVDDPTKPGQKMPVTVWMKPGQTFHSMDEINRARVIQVPDTVNPPPPAAPKPGEQGPTQPATPPVVAPVVRRGNEAATKVTPGLYNTTILRDYQTSLGKQTSNLQERQTKLMGFINTITNPQVKMDIQEIIGDPEMRAASYEDLVGSGRLVGDPQHLEMVKEVLAAIRGF